MRGHACAGCSAGCTPCACCSCLPCPHCRFDALCASPPPAYALQWRPASRRCPAWRPCWRSSTLAAASPSLCAACGASSKRACVRRRRRQRSMAAAWRRPWRRAEDELAGGRHPTPVVLLPDRPFVPCAPCSSPLCHFCRSCTTSLLLTMDKHMLPGNLPHVLHTPVDAPRSGLPAMPKFQSAAIPSFRISSAALHAMCCGLAPPVPTPHAAVLRTSAAALTARGNAGCCPCPAASCHYFAAHNNHRRSLQRVTRRRSRVVGRRRALGGRRAGADAGLCPSTDTRAHTRPGWR